MEEGTYRSRLKEVGELLAQSSRCLLVSHMSPDADAFGASCGLTLALQRAGKDALCVNEGPAHPRYLKMPGVEKVQRLVPREKWDVLLVLDCGSWQRVGESMAAQLAGISPVINLDHHVAGDSFGDLSVVRPEACSTSEIVWDLLCTMNIRPTCEAATCLLWGLMGDTGSFRFGSTSARTFEIARELVLCGASPAAVADGLYAGKPLCQVRLEGEALAGVQLRAAGQLAEIVVTDEMYQRLGAASEHTEELVDSAREIADVRIAALIYRQQNLWKVSLRVRGGDLDVSQVARMFGGGGHRAAAAFRWRKDLEELRARLIPELEKLLK